MAVWEIEPWGEMSSTWQLALVGSLLINAWRDKGHHVEPKELMPGHREDPAPAQSVEVQKALVSQVLTAAAARTGRKP